MTNVIFNVFEETSKGDKAVKYSIVAKRAKRRIEDGKIYTLTPIREDGFYGKILELESTSLGEAWIITVSTSNDTLNGYYKIPDVNEILFTELIKVDPESLEPDATPDPEWWEVAKSTINGGVVNAEGELILTRSDGVKVNAGHVEGEPGKPGQDGVSVKGAPGKDGAGIGDAFITDDGDLELVRTDGVVFTPGRVVGRDGEDGANDFDVATYIYDSESETRSALSTAVDARAVKRGELFEIAPAPSGGDDTEALNASADSAYEKDPNTILFISGKYKTSGAVNIRCSLDASQATFNYSGTGDALILGNISSPGIATSRRTYVLPRLIRVDANSFDGSSRGVRLVNLNSCIIISQFIQYFEEGMVAEGYGQGFVHNTVYPGTLWGNRRNLVLRIGETGWANENQYFGGRFSNPPWGVVDDPLAGFIVFEKGTGVIASPNSNKFYGTSMEGNNAHLYRVTVEGNYNVFEYCRWEHAESQTVRILYGTSANYTVLNGGYDQHKVVEVFSGATLSNKRTVQTGTIFVRSNQLTGTTLPNAEFVDITTWVTPSGFFFTYNEATGEFTPRPGRYLVRAKIPFASSISTGDRTVRILKNGSVQSAVIVPGKTGNHTVEVTDEITFNGIDKLKIQVYQNSGAPCALSTAGGYAQMSAELIR